MTPSMIAALASKRKNVTAFFQVDLPSGTKRMLLGSGEVTWGGNTFKGYDPTFGTIVGGDSVTEETSGQAPNTAFTLQVASTAIKTDIASEAVQLAPVKIWLAAITLDGINHFVAVADPELLFDGFIDQATSSLDKNKDEIDYTLVSGFDYFFEDSEGQRASSGFHHSVWPSASDEKGMDNVSGVTRKVYWGAYGSNGDSPVSGPVGNFATGGGGNCVTVDSFILLANGDELPVSRLQVGDLVWTAHEFTGELGAYAVEAVELAEEDVMSAAGWPDATPDHRFGLAREGGLEWIRMRELGQPRGSATVARITVAEAHTYMARHPDCEDWRLSHNVKVAVA